MVSVDFLVQRLLRKSENAIIFFDAEGVIVGWHGNAETIFGYTAAEIVGRHSRILFTDEDRQRGVPEHELQEARNSNWAEDDRWLTRMDGTRFWAAGTTSALQDDSGEVVGFGKILRERADIRQQLDTLDNRVKALTSFIAVLGHEIRNPLHTLSISMSALTKLVRGTAAELANMGLRQAAFMTRLVNDLQDASRVSAGKLKLQRQRVAIQDVLKKAARDVRMHATARGQNFREILLPSALMVDVDPDRMYQVVCNLLENAIKYTPEGGSVYLKCTVEAPEAVIRVEDTGIGIDSTALPHIFDLFTQEKPSETRAHELGAGLGLGLALVRDLITLHGGTVQVRSEGRNKGAEFIIRLPLAAE
jgi:PAS domain S-box-containing protein